MIGPGLIKAKCGKTRYYVIMNPDGLYWATDSSGHYITSGRNLEKVVSDCESKGYGK